MRRYCKNPIVISWAGICATYWTASLFVPSRELIIFMDALVVAFSAAVVLVYSPKVIDGLGKESPDVYDGLIVGIAIGWSSNLFDRMFRMYIRVTERAELLDSPLIGAFLAGLLIAAAMHLLVRGSAQKEDIHGGISVSAWGAIVATGTAGAALGLFVLSLAHSGP